MPVAKKTAPARRAMVREAVEPKRPEPLIRLKRTTATAPAAEQVLLFTKEYDDDQTPDVEFWVPKKAMASLALKFMHMARHEGDNTAVSWALEEVLGEEAYADLMDDDQLEDDELLQIFALVQNAIMGAAKDPKGRSR